MSNKSFNIGILLIILFSIFISCFFIPIFAYSNNIVFEYNTTIENSTFTINNQTLLWPIPGYTKITSNFGYRKSPTAGASSFHGGIDIAAPPYTNLVAICDGKVIFIGWANANGYAIKVQSNNIIFTYAHIDPNFLVKIGQGIKKGTTIAKVGPLNVYDVPNNPYKDKLGKPTNGATTRSSFTLFYQ